MSNGKIEKNEAAKKREPHPLMRWFDGSHLRSKPLRKMVRAYESLALAIDELEPGAEKVTALRKLLESKDAAVRAMIEEGLG